MLASVSITTALAAYGAILSSTTAVLGFIQWRLTHGTRVTVSLRAAELHGWELQAPPAPVRIVLVRMTNHSSHRVAITHLHLQRKSGSYLSIPRPQPIEEPLPVLIEPRRSKDLWVTADAMKAHLEEPLRAYVSTDDANDFYSKWVVVADAMHKEIDRIRR